MGIARMALRISGRQLEASIKASKRLYKVISQRSDARALRLAFPPHDIDRRSEPSAQRRWQGAWPNATLLPAAKGQGPGRPGTVG